MTARHRTRRGSPLHITRARDLFAISRDLILKNIKVFGPLYFVALIFSFNSWASTPDLGSHTDKSGWMRYSWFGTGFSSSVPNYLWYIMLGLSVFWVIFVFIVGTIVQIMAQDAQLRAARHEKVSLERSWKTVKELGWRMLGLYLLIGLYIVVGLIFFIIPGLIMLRRYFLAPYVMLDEKVTVKEAMEKSAAITGQFSRSIWGIIGIMFSISLLFAFPFIGWMIAFVAGMLYSAAPALRYLELKKISN
jgi:hypothetical protein